MWPSCAVDAIGCSDVGVGGIGDEWMGLAGLILMLAAVLAVTVWIARR